MMHCDGLTKLIEECGELVQIAAKKQAYFDTDTHPDGKGSMKRRLEEEMADVMAACVFVAEKFGLDGEFLEARAQKKLELFKSWDNGPNV
jgi:NTP pyrophosphatase (non-canonical NTP hydrolase)